MGNWDGSKPNNDGERELIDRAVKALEAELATKTCNKQIVSKLENAELARDSDVTCNNKQVTSKLVASEDAISRQAAIDAFSMFAEYESNRTNAEWVDRIRVVLSSLPSVTPNQVPCEDAISRQLVIKAIYDYNSLINIAQAVRELPPVQPISRWIPVTDKLPSDCDEDWVLVQIQEDNGYLWIPRVMEYRKLKDDWWGEDIGWLKNHNGAFKVIAWMPLPKPFKPQESEEQE